MTSTHWTGKKSEVGGTSSITLTTDSTVPSNTSITLTLFEDVGSDQSGPNTDALGNSYENSASTTLSGGTGETNTLSGFDGGGSTNDYWLKIELAGNGSDPTLASPNLSSVSVDAAGATTESVSISGAGGVTVSETVSIAESSTVAGAGSVAVAEQVSVTRSESVTVTGGGSVTASETITAAESATITGAGTVAVSEQALVRWRIDNSIIQPTSDITATPTTLSLTFEVDRSNIGTWRAYDTAGDFDTVDGHGGHFRTVDRAGRSSSVTVTPGTPESPPFTTAEYYVSSYGETQIAADRIQVSLQLRRLSNRDGAFSPVNQSGGDWQFDTDSGTVALDAAQVARSTVEGTTAQPQWRFSVSVSADQAATLVDDVGYPGGVVERPTPDGSNQLVDNSHNSRQTVTVTAPTGVVPDGDYVVQDWRLGQAGYATTRRWQVELTVALIDDWLLVVVAGETTTLSTNESYEKTVVNRCGLLDVERGGSLTTTRSTRS